MPSEGSAACIEENSKTLSFLSRQTMEQEKGRDRLPLARHPGEEASLPSLFIHRRINGERRCRPFLSNSASTKLCLASSSPSTRKTGKKREKISTTISPAFRPSVDRKGDGGLSANLSTKEGAGRRRLSARCGRKEELPTGAPSGERDRGNELGKKTPILFTAAGGVVFPFVPCISL